MNWYKLLLTGPASVHAIKDWNKSRCVTRPPCRESLSVSGASGPATQVGNWIKNSAPNNRIKNPPNRAMTEEPRTRRSHFLLTPTLLGLGGGRGEVAIAVSGCSWGGGVRGAAICRKPRNNTSSTTRRSDIDQFLGHSPPWRRTGPQTVSSRQEPSETKGRRAHRRGGAPRRGVERCDGRRGRRSYILSWVRDRQWACGLCSARFLIPGAKRNPPGIGWRRGWIDDDQNIVATVDVQEARGPASPARSLFFRPGLSMARPGPSGPVPSPARDACHAVQGNRPAGPARARPVNNGWPGRPIPLFDYIREEGVAVAPSRLPTLTRSLCGRRSILSSRESRRGN